MPYTREDAIREVGNSTDWAVGLEASIKKYEQRVAGDVTSYKRSERCGLCFVAFNRGVDCTCCLASSICEEGAFAIDTSEEILQALKKLRKEMSEMDCKDKCANYKPVEVERPIDHPNRIFAEDLRIGMVIRRHNMPLDRKLVVILAKPGKIKVRSLQFKVCHSPHECNLWLANSGLQPYNSGNWHRVAWCEEVT